MEFVSDIINLNRFDDVVNDARLLLGQTLSQDIDSFGKMWIDIANIESAVPGWLYEHGVSFNYLESVVHGILVSIMYVVGLLLVGIIHFSIIPE